MVVTCLATVQLYYVYKYVSNSRIQADLYYLVLMFPVSIWLFCGLILGCVSSFQVTTLCNVAGMFIPRAAPFLYAVALV